MKRQQGTLLGHFKKLYRYRPMARMMQISTMSNTKFRVERICSRRAREWAGCRGWQGTFRMEHPAVGRCQDASLLPLGAQARPISRTSQH